MLNLEYRGETKVPVEVEGVTPDTLREKSIAEIEKLPIYHGNREIPLAEFFHVSGDPADGIHKWMGNLAGVHWIGAKMTQGKIEIEGNAGRHLGSEMRGGEIIVRGNAGDWVGGEMHGGVIHVRGNAGHLIGAAYRGSARGMTKGTILIDGDAGNEIGHTLRRGLIAIGGNAGDLAGFNMLAGTLLLFGESGIRHGAGMKRGTIGFLSSHHPPLLPTFRRAYRCRPGFLNLLLRYLKSFNFPLPAGIAQAEFDHYHGDMIEGGRGEILLMA